MKRKLLTVIDSVGQDPRGVREHICHVHNNVLERCRHLCATRVTIT